MFILFQRNAFSSQRSNPLFNMSRFSGGSLTLASYISFRTKQGPAFTRPVENCPKVKITISNEINADKDTKDNNIGGGQAIEADFQRMEGFIVNELFKPFLFQG
jgi:hypothetical protein